MESPQVDARYLLHKFPGKGGWTYAEIPEIVQNKNNPFGWVTVSGSIDGYELKQYKLMPMGSGRLFLPVKAEIRKKIKKEAGDIVHIILSIDESPLELTEELMECFRNEHLKIYENFCQLKEFQRRYYLHWIYDAKTDETKANRILKMMEDLNWN